MKMISEACRRHSKRDGSWWMYDAAGIALCRVCAKCEAAKRSTYEPRIFAQHSTYAMTGEEVDIHDSPDDYRNG